MSEDAGYDKSVSEDAGCDKSVSEDAEGDKSYRLVVMMEVINQLVGRWR